MKDNRKNRKLTIISVRNSMRKLQRAGLINKFKVKPLRSLNDPVKVVAVPTVAASYIDINLAEMRYSPESEPKFIAGLDKGVRVPDRSGFVILPQPA